MRRVVITGMGIVSCLGSDQSSVIQSLREGRSGIRFNEQYREAGLRSRVSGSVDPGVIAGIDHRHKRMMGDAAAYAYVALRDAIADAGLTAEHVSSPRTGVIAGSGGGSNFNIIEAADILRAKGVRKVGPFRVPRAMGSTVSACLSTFYGIRGVNYSITSACATSAHCIGAAMEQIKLDRQDIVFAGGGEEEHWSLAVLFDAMGALSSCRNDTPETASRAFDADRDGFVIAGGGGILVLEELEHARRRGANIIAELVGYAATSDGHDMVAPSGKGAAHCMWLALRGVVTPVDYINAHGTGTLVGDMQELAAIRRVFIEGIPPISSTKSLSGHSLGAAGVQEAIYSLLMLKHGFIAASANIECLDPEAADMPIVRHCRDAGLRTVMSNSFGFGGTNASLVFRKCEHA